MNSRTELMIGVNNINKYYTNNLILTINSYDDLLRYKRIKKDIYQIYKR